MIRKWLKAFRARRSPSQTLLRGANEGIADMLAEFDRRNRKDDRP